MEERWAALLVHPLEELGARLELDASTCAPVAFKSCSRGQLQCERGSLAGCRRSSSVRQIRPPKDWPFKRYTDLTRVDIKVNKLFRRSIPWRGN